MKQLIILIIIFFSGCLKQNGSVIKNEMILFYPTLDSVRDIELISDTLYVANGSEGLKILKLNLDDTESIESIYEGPIFTGEQDIIGINITQNSQLLFVLDKFKYTYVGSINFFTGLFGLENIACDEYQSKLTIIEDNENTEILTIYRHLDTVNETQPYTASIDKVEIEQIPGLDLYNKNCLGSSLDSLNYDLFDIHYFNGILYLANPNFSIPSIQIYTQNIDDNFELVREDTLLAYPKTVRGYESAYVVGLDNDAGCYIALLDTEGVVISKFTMFDGYTIRDIHYSQGLLLFSAGYDGVLVCKWDGEGEPIPYAIISSSYAYSALVYNENKIIIGTKNGIEIYKID